MTPDTRSLSGVQNFSLGESTTRTYWQPRFDISVSADSNGNEVPNNPSWNEWTSFSGGVDVHRTSGNSNMSLSYTGGGMFSNSSNVSNGIVQVLSISDAFTFRRFSVSLFEQLNYLPESSFGFGGLGGTPLPGSGLSGLGSGFGAGQSILTGRGQNLGNSFVTELDTYLTPRTSLTFAGGYSLLKYFDSSLFDYNDMNFRFGYNYQMTRKDTVAVLYTFSGLRYSNQDQSINEHTAQVSYGRRVTGRLAFRIAGGPQVVFSRMPITGMGGSAGNGGETGPPGSTTSLYWSVNTALQYQINRTELGLNYNHGVTGGSGVLNGSVTDIVTGSASRQVSRTFSSGISGGYSRNQGIAITSETPSNQTFDYWFGGANFAHPVGRSLGLSLSYQLQYQDSNSAFCIGPTCGTSVIRHLISVSVGWHERPLLF